MGALDREHQLVYESYDRQRTVTVSGDVYDAPNASGDSVLPMRQVIGRIMLMPAPVDSMTVEERTALEQATGATITGSAQQDGGLLLTFSKLYADGVWSSEASSQTQVESIALRALGFFSTYKDQVAE